MLDHPDPNHHHIMIGIKNKQNNEQMNVALATFQSFTKISFYLPDENLGGSGKTCKRLKQ